VSDALGTFTATHTTKMMGAGISQARVSLGHMAAPLRRPQELTRMPKDKSILLVANARPFEVGKLYFFRDPGMRRLVEQTGAHSIDVPSLRRWTEPSAWLGAHSKSGLATKTPQGESPLRSFTLQSEESKVGTTNSDGDTGGERGALKAEISDSIAGIGAEVQRVIRSASSDATDDIGSALKEFTAIAERIQKNW
jgi:type IV secretion system protein VirD4